MKTIFSKLPLLIELFFNGLFIILYSIQKNPAISNLIQPELFKTILNFLSSSVVFVIGFSVIFYLIQSRSFEALIRRHVFSIIVLIPLIITFGDHKFSYWLAIVHLFSSILSIMDANQDPGQMKRSKMDLGLIHKLNLKPAQVVLATFSMIILVGAFLLFLPIAAAPGKEISFIDALFTATSATCVTGLSTISLSDNFSLFGQIVVLVLIQVGGLGIMTLSSSLTILMGRSLAMKHKIVMQDILEISSLSELISMIVDIIKYTLVIELWGGVFLSVAFYNDGQEFSTALYNGFFHSISAFCNAGFSTFNNSLEGFVTNPIVNMTISTLIIFGGAGFIVLKEMKHAIMKRKSFVDLSIHTRVVLITNLILIITGTVVIFFSEFLHVLELNESYSLFDKLQIAYFQSVTTRTAGFNTIPLTELYPHTLYFITLFMFIGASPGSTGGGIKTTTFAILIQSVTSTLRGRKNVEFFDRTIPTQAVTRAISVIIISLIIVSVFIFLLMKIEVDKSFMTIFFEVISAFATVGLSLGITGYLSVAGKFAIVILMFIGRVGPLTLVLAFGQNTKSQGQVEYPTGRLMIG